MHVAQLAIHNLLFIHCTSVPADWRTNVNSTKKKFWLKSSVGKLDVAIECPKSGDNLVLHVLNALYFALHALPSANSDVQVPRVRDYQVLLSKIRYAMIYRFIRIQKFISAEPKKPNFEFHIKTSSKGYFLNWPSVRMLDISTICFGIFLKNNTRASLCEID